MSFTHVLHLKLKQQVYLLPRSSLNQTTKRPDKDVDPLIQITLKLCFGQILTTIYRYSQLNLYQYDTETTLECSVLTLLYTKMKLFRI